MNDRFVYIVEMPHGYWVVITPDIELAKKVHKEWKEHGAILIRVSVPSVNLLTETH